MAEFKLGRIRFVWKNNWQAATVYYKDDVVRFGGKTYVCQVGHTSNTDFNVDLDFSPTKWNIMSDGQEWKSDWTTETVYKPGDLVKYGSYVYICITGHTSAATATLGLEADQAKWELFAEGVDWKGDWNADVRYKKGDLARYGGYTYVCNTGHTSAATSTLGLEADQAKWDTFNPGTEYKTDWSTPTRYKVNDIVKYGGGLYICVDDHTSTDFISDEANWARFLDGIDFEEQWSISTTYQPGDVVRYGGNQYIAKTNHVGSVPSVAVSDWALFTEGFNFASDWAVTQNYRIGDVVRVNGNTYLAIADSPSIVATVSNTDNSTDEFTVDSTTGFVAGMVVKFTGTTFGNVFNGATYFIGSVVDAATFIVDSDEDGTTFTPTTASGSMTATVAAHPTNTSYFSLLNSGISWQGTWSDDTEYEVGDAVQYETNSYLCIKKHRSEQDDGSTIIAEGGGSGNSRPDQDLTGVYWEVISVGSETSVLTTAGDLVYYAEGVGPTRLPIGTEGQVLRVSADLIPEWTTLGYADHTYYVNLNTGTDFDDGAHGISLDKPYKTVRYAAEQVERGPRFPKAQKLLEINRAFIQREVSAWIRYQIANATSGSIWENFDYDEYKCERDVGFIIDRVKWDLGHGGNLKIRAAAQTFLNVLADGPFSTAEENNGTGPYNNLIGEASQSVAAYNYMLTVVESVLDQQAPDTIYQNVSDDSTAIATQNFDIDIITAEPGALPIITSLVGVITTVLTSRDTDDIPARIQPNNLIRVSTGQYYETLPIIVPASTCVQGDELRSTNVSAASSLINPEDAFYSLQIFDRLDPVLSDIVLGNTVTPSTGNVVPQISKFPFADVEQATIVSDLIQTIKHKIDYNLGTMYNATLTDPTDYNVSYLVGYGNARKLISYNKKFLQEEVIAFLIADYPNLAYGKTDTRRDTGYIIDAVIYDLTYSGNALSVKAGLAYWDGDDGSEPQIPASIKAATLASLTFLKNRMISVASDATFTPLQTDIARFRGTAGSAGAQTLISNNLDTIIEIVDNGPIEATYTLADPAPTDTVNTTTALITAYGLLNAAVETIKDDTITFISANYPGLIYNTAKCERDVGIILKAVGFDFMYNGNYQTIKAAHSYLRGTASEVYSLNQKTATRAALEYVRTQAIANVGGDSTAISRINTLFGIIDVIIYGGSNEGSVCQTDERNRDYAALLLELNRPFVIEEVNRYILENFETTVDTASSSDNTFTVASGLPSGELNWLTRNAAIRFTGETFGDVIVGRTYYVREIVSDTKFTISETRFGPEFELSDVAGSMTVLLSYDSALCLRDVGTYIDALKYDLKYPGNYRSLYIARYYTNGVTGSREEDMFYLRDATGLRNMSLSGLNGDLTPPNTAGTSRVTAGAYASLDPGWGPADFTTWIIDRSPYVQGITTFGNGAIGQKIDGALHDGGNDSIVSNDFTQVISDGIGAWVTNNGRAELVSVFTYYAHIGYLCENGGRIRGTNGNNSYGDFGAVAEGVDSSETANTGVVDNIFRFEAEISQIFTDGSQLLRFEFLNAGIDYTEITYGLTGGGTGGSVEADEFRDDGVYQVRLLEGTADEEVFGGSGYITASNTAQGGSSTSITLAATDGNPSGRYIGMTIILTGGTAAGQTAIITSYNAGTKLADVQKISDSTSGWDHVVPGITVVSPDASTTYTIVPTAEFSSPGFTSEEITLNASATYNDVIFGETAETYTGLTGTYSGSGSPVDAVFTVVRNAWKYTATCTSGGSGYERLETITIAGTALGGTSPANDLVITITSVDETTGAIILLDDDLNPVTSFDIAGTGVGGLFVALKDTSSTGAYSADGVTWTNMNMPSTQEWASVTHGLIDDGSSTQKTSVFVAVAISSNVAAYSNDGINWTSSTLPATANWTSVIYGNGRFVAIASDSTTTAVSLDGFFWEFTGTLPFVDFVEVTYGKGLFVAVRTSSTNAATSTDGITWITRTLPDSLAWTSVVWGNNRFVAVATDSNNGAYSLDGTTWATTTLGSLDGSSTAGYQSIRYGQGLFVAAAYLAGVTGYSWTNTSEDGINWTPRGTATEAPFTGYASLAFGTPNRKGYWVALPYDTSDKGARIRTGTTAKAVISVAEDKVFEIKITEPGSGYDSVPALTITDPGVIHDVFRQVRIGKGVLANPSFVNRGSSYVSGSASITDGDGFADNYQPLSFIAVRRITQRPAAGSNIVFSHRPNTVFKLVSILSFIGSVDGSYTAFVQISPAFSIADAPDHLTTFETRIRYSQVRLTGHDFLDIGTGGFAETNYPGIPINGPIPARETFTASGGRVFFTSTDQDGNFRVGDLFAVEQSTGIATLNADAFNIAGLQELSLGNVTLGSGSATVTEFSTDPFFSADSDNVVPTQRAVKAYIASQIGGGGASLNVNSINAGSILINSNQITTITDGPIQMNATFDFRGGIIGVPLALNFMLI